MMFYIYICRTVYTSIPKYPRWSIAYLAPKLSGCTAMAVTAPVCDSCSSCLTLWPWEFMGKISYQKWWKLRVNHLKWGENGDVMGRSWRIMNIYIYIYNFILYCFISIFIVLLKIINIIISIIIIIVFITLYYIVLYCTIFLTMIILIIILYYNTICIYILLFIYCVYYRYCIYYLY